VSYSAQQCLDMAKECGRMASQAKDRDAKAALIEFARQWLELKGFPAEVNRGFPRADRGRILCALIRREVGHARNVSQ